MEEITGKKLAVTSPAFEEGGWIPRIHTARGADYSPQLDLTGLCTEGRSLAVTMDDASHPLFPNYNHWVLWNLPVMTRIPSGIPKGKSLGAFSGAVQGRAYGRHCYKGPKPPLGAVHSYVFTIYVLDCVLALAPQSRRKDFLRAAEGHILQTGTLMGKFQNRRK